MSFRKIAFPLLLLAGLAASLWGLHQFYPLPLVKISAFRAVPKFSAFLFELTSFENTPSPWDAWELSRQWATLGEMESVFADSTQDRPAFRRALALLQPVGQAQMGWLGIWEARDASGRLQRWLSRHPAPASRFKQVAIYSGTAANGSPFAIARFRNLLIAAPYPFLVEDAIRQLKSGSAARLPLQSGAGDRIALQPAQIARQWINVQSEEGRQTWALWRNWKGWSELSVQPDSAGWTASGRWYPEQEPAWWQDLLSAVPASPQAVCAVLPEQTLAFWWQPPTGEAWWSSGPGRRFLKPWWNGEWAAGLLPGYGGEGPSAPFWVGGIRSEEAVNAWLDQWASEQGELERYPYQTFVIRQLIAEPGLPLPWAQEPLPIRNPYLVQLENYIVLCPSKPALEVWLDQYIAGQVLARAGFFLSASSRLPQEAVAWGYLQGDRGGRLLGASFQPPQTLPFLNKGQLQAAFLPAGAELQIEVVKSEEEALSAPVAVAWKANLDAPALDAPQAVYDGSAWSWLVQDEQMALYCIGPSGKIRWKRPLGSRVISRIYPIAYYSEQPRELLFNTADAIYMLDEDGQLVSTFPLRLQSAATNGLLLVDFSGQRDYGIFVACTNSRLYGFDRYGRPLEGWSPGPLVGRAEYPIRHFQFDRKDYLVVNTRDGFVHVFQRDGAERFPSVPLGYPPEGPPEVQVLGQSARIVQPIPGGRVQVINPLGASFTLNVPAGEEEPADFSFADVTGDERKDYLLLGREEIDIYFYEKEAFKLWKKIALPHPQTRLLTGIASPGEKAWYGTFDAYKRQLFLFTPDGKLAPGFPLAGSTGFSLVQLPEGKLLVAALDGDVYGYLVMGDW
jgi:hypothetical protein